MFEIVEEYKRKYYFVGPSWNEQFASRYVLRKDRIHVESSFYLHLDSNRVVNVALEPSLSHGCPVRCRFCASGALSPVVWMSSKEIEEQIRFLWEELRRSFALSEDVPVYVFYAGIGEPTLVCERVLEASFSTLERLPFVAFKVSTMAADPKSLHVLARSDLPFRSLQITLPHFREDRLKFLFQGCPGYSLYDALEAVREFSSFHPRAKVKVNFIVIRGFNDDETTLSETIKLASRFLTDFELKVSCLNPTPVSERNGLYPVGLDRMRKLVETATQEGIRAYVFGPVAEGVGCGQLIGKYYRKLTEKEASGEATG